ncbi:MAG TPA: PEP-CTERM sorting domain-containing protein [Candidatus Bathyarchaeia archaeon]|nr:PEP-CTERM sorting domain-containing protein [Candidatus Bathyarchaeia archaeon]
MKQCVLISVVVVCTLAVPMQLCADAIPFAYSGPGVSVSGTFFGSDNANGSWTITGIDATYNNIQVSEIVAPGFDPRFLYNNLYYEPGYADFAVDYLGIVFNVPGLGDVNLCTYTPSGGCGDGGYYSILWSGHSYQFTPVDFVRINQSQIASATPEPATLALLGSGLTAVGVLTRKRWMS